MSDQMERLGTAVSAHGVAASARFVALEALRRWRAAPNEMTLGRLREAAEAMLVAEARALAADVTAGRARPDRGGG